MVETMAVEVVRNPFFAEVAAHYHACRLIVFDNLLLTHLSALRALSIHGSERFKKLKAKDAFLPIRELPRHALGVWTLDRKRAAAIQEMLRDNEAEIREYVRAWFPDAELGDEMHSWRYTVTKDEALHYDQYADRVNEKVVRVFINLDTEPRVWHVGDEAELIEFAPGAVWLVDSRRVAHAIVYGRRAAMFSFQLRGVPWDA